MSNNDILIQTGFELDILLGGITGNFVNGHFILFGLARNILVVNHDNLGQAIFQLNGLLCSITGNIGNGHFTLICLTGNVLVFLQSSISLAALGRGSKVGSLRAGIGKIAGSVKPSKVSLHRIGHLVGLLRKSCIDSSTAHRLIDADAGFNKRLLCDVVCEFAEFRRLVLDVVRFTLVLLVPVCLLLRRAVRTH